MRNSLFFASNTLFILWSLLSVKGFSIFVRNFETFLVGALQNETIGLMGFPSLCNFIVA